MVKGKWFTLGRLAVDLGSPVEELRVIAEAVLDLDAYDPELDMVSATGRARLVEQLRDG